MAKISILIGIGLLFYGASYAVPVDPSAPDGVAAVCTVGRQGNDFYGVQVVLCVNGTVKALNWGQWWEFSFLTEDLPVPVSEVVDWEPGYFEDTAGVKHFYNTQSQYGSAGWYRLDQLAPLECGQAIDGDGTGLGDLKSMFR